MHIIRKAGLSALALTLSAATAWGQTPQTATPAQPPAKTSQPAPPAPISTPAGAPPSPPRPQEAPSAAPPPTPSPSPEPAATNASAAPAGVPSSHVIVCGTTEYRPLDATKQPAAGSGPVLLAIAPCFDKQGGASVIEPQTYLYYIQTKFSRPSQDVWVPFNDVTEQQIHDDFKRLWATNFLDDLSIETKDYQFPNGTIGKIVVYNM